MARIAIGNPFNSSWDGEAITQGLRAFNNWRDEFLIELSTLLLMLGFVVGTIDVFTNGGFSQWTPVNYAWAIIQAVSIDGLFFAIWGKIRRIEWTKRTAFSNIMLILIGLLLAFVASLVNNILGYQELNHITNIAQAMANLGIDQATFSYGRSFLVVLIAILIALFAKNHGPTLKELQATIARLGDEIEGLRAIRDSLTKDKEGLAQRATSLENERKTWESRAIKAESDLATTTERERQGLQAMATQMESERASWANDRQELQATIDDLKRKLAQAKSKTTLKEAVLQKWAGQGERAISPESSPNGQGYIAHDERANTDHEQGYIAHDEKAISHDGQGYIARDDGTTIAISSEAGDTIVATGKARDRIKAAIMATMKRGDKINYKEIATAAQAGYSTVKLHAPMIIEEITQEYPAIVAAQDTTAAGQVGEIGEDTP